MKTEVKVPGFPESITDGTVVAWHKRPGEAVKRDETLVDIETDKVMFEVPAPEDGTLGEILQPEGATVVAGQVLASIDAATGKPASAARGNGEDKAPPAQKIVMPAARRLLDDLAFLAARLGLPAPHAYPAWNNLPHEFVSPLPEVAGTVDVAMPGPAHADHDARGGARGDGAVEELSQRRPVGPGGEG